jgi:hypothetical protein
MKKQPVYVLLLFVAASCVYTVSPNSFKEQYIKPGRETTKKSSGSALLSVPQHASSGVVAGVLLLDLLSAGHSDTKSREVNQLKTIIAKDKNGEEVIVDKEHAIESRVITKNGKRLFSSPRNDIKQRYAFRNRDKIFQTQKIAVRQHCSI